MSQPQHENAKTISISPVFDENKDSDPLSRVEKTTVKGEGAIDGPKHSRIGDAFQIPIDCLPNPKLWSQTITSSIRE